MLYGKISDFLFDWKNTSEATLKIFGALTDKSLSQEVTSRGRTIGGIAWHIAHSIPEMLSRTGLAMGEFDEKSDAPGCAKAIYDEYERFSKQLVSEISSKWSDADLEKEVNMYGEMWKNGMTLQILICHEIHHRAQMTVLMRQAGLKVPGIMGPSAEEWEALGMPPQK